MKPFCWVGALLAVAVLVTGCGEGSDAGTVERIPENRQKLDFGLDGDPNPQDAGVLLASRLGYFEEVGFDADIRPPLAPERPVGYVASGALDVSISHLPEVALAQDEGVPVIAIASLISQPTAAMIWLEGSQIDEIADLKGKTIAIPGVPFQEAFLENILAGAGLSLADVTLERVGYELVPALVSGRADAIFGGSANVEGVELEERGLEPVVTPVSDLGVPAYDELVVIARSDRLARDPQAFRDILAAVARGTATAIEEPEAAIDIVTDEGEESEEEALEAAVEATLPLLSEGGEMDTGQAEELIGWMREEGMIKREPPASELFTNDYLESQK